MIWNSSVGNNCHTSARKTFDMEWLPLLTSLSAAFSLRGVCSPHLDSTWLDASGSGWLFFTADCSTLAGEAAHAGWTRSCALWRWLHCSSLLSERGGKCSGFTFLLWCSEVIVKVTNVFKFVCTIRERGIHVWALDGNDNVPTANKVNEKWIVFRNVN